MKNIISFRGIQLKNYYYLTNQDRTLMEIIARNRTKYKPVSTDNSNHIKNDNNDNVYLIKNVEIVPGNTIEKNWQREMQIVYTDKSDYIDNIPRFGGHDWQQDIGKKVEAKTNESAGYYWIRFYKHVDEVDYSNSVDELPLDYNINENEELTKIYDYIKQDIPVMFLTGGAGTGKSTFIRYLKRNLKNELNKNCIVLAPTGVASINVGGQTIHSFFGFKTDIFENEEIDKLQKNSVIEHTDLIIIDEISMVSSWMLDHIDYALRLWCDGEKPFGGKQMLFIGDCFQLPPIAENDEVKQKFFDRWDNSFFFAAEVLKIIDMKAVQLKKIYRQKDDKSFIHMLNRIRKCQHGYEKDIEFLNENCFIETRLGTKNVPEECLLLTTKNIDAEKFNTLKMNNLQQKGARSKTFDGQVTGKFNFEHFLTPKILDLCIGAKIMVTKNLSSQNLANGDMGRVVDFGTDYVDIEVKGKRCRLYKEKWQSLRYTWNEQTKSIQQIEEGSFTQIPLKLGWAVTIHKSQGLTLDAVAIDAADAWDSGQVYVALSRARNLNGILLQRKIPISAVKTNDYIKKIYEELFPESDKEDLYNNKEYEDIKFDNALFSIDQSKEITTVNIGGIDFELYSSGSIQNHVRKTMSILLANNLIPENEMHRLLNDYNYCYAVFGINWNGYKYTLLRKDRNVNAVRYWANSYNGYYICSQWYQNLASNFAKWLIALSKGQLNSYSQPTELLKNNLDYESGIDWAKKKQEEKERIFAALFQQQEEMRLEQMRRQNTPNYYNKKDYSSLIKHNSYVQRKTTIDEETTIVTTKESITKNIDTNVKIKKEDTLPEVKLIASFVVSRTPTLKDGLVQFIKEDGSYLCVDNKCMRNSSLPWTSRKIKINVYKKENDTITDWGWTYYNPK